MMTLDEWATDVNGRVIGSGQCVALVEDYAQRVCGTGQISTDGTEHPGYAREMWHNGPAAGYAQHSPNEPAMPGWIAVWEFGFKYTPLSHVAVVLNDGGTNVQCMTQNPGAAHTMGIPKIGLLGYLSPGGGGGTISTAANIQTAGNVISDANNFLSVWPKVSNWVTNSHNWQRIGLAAIGVIAILIVLIKLFNMETTVKDAIQNVTAN